MKKWFWLPLLAGAFLAIFWPKKPSPSPAASFRLSSYRRKPSLAPEQPLANYLLTSQLYFSRAISLSQKKDQDWRRHNQLVSRLVNEAISQASNAIAHYPTDPRGYAQRARIYQAIEKYLSGAKLIACRDWEQAGRLSQHDPSYWRQAARLRQQMGDFAKAAADLNQALALAPADAQLLFELAQAESRAGWLKAARNHYRQLLALLVDENQRHQISQQIKALDRLLAQNPGQLAASPTPAPLELPLKTPKLEAEAVSRPLLVAAPAASASSQTSAAALANAFSGVATLATGSTSLRLQNRHVNSRAAIYLTSLDDSDNQPLRLLRKEKGAFWVGLKRPLKHRLRFRWLIVPAP